MDLDVSKDLRGTKEDHKSTIKQAHEQASWEVNQGKQILLLGVLRAGNIWEGWVYQDPFLQSMWLGGF